MDKKELSGSHICRTICGAADELRDTWLSRQPKSSIREIGSLSISQQRMMRALLRLTENNPDGVMLKELAENLSLSSSAVSVMVESMVQHGVLERIASTEDRRRVMIRISEEGWTHVRRSEMFFVDFCEEFIDSVPQAELKKSMDILEKLIHFLRNKNKKEIEK